MDEQRVRRRLKDALNGDYDEMDAPTRRGFVALAAEMDAIHDGLREIDHKLARLSGIMVGSSSAIVIAAVVNVILT